MKPASILITDDESNIRMMLRTALEADGYLVEEASNGRQALEKIKERSPDLMVLDLNMPVVDGMAVLQELKSWPTSAKPRVIILTAYGSIATAVKATRLGAVDFLEKPVTPADLRQTIRSVLNEPELDAPPILAEVTTGYELVLQKIRASLRMADLSSAESLLMKAAERREAHGAEYFNLLGVLYEAQQKWRLARKCYGKAISADRHFEAAQTNMQRIYELYTFGASKRPVQLGDETAAASKGLPV